MGEDYENPELLYDLYVEQELSQRDIADRLDCACSTIHKRLKKYNIKSRSKSEAAMNRSDRGGKYANEDWLHQKYIEEKKSIPKIAEMCDVTYSTIEHWLNEFDIPTRNISEGISNFYIQRDTVPTTHDPNGYEYWSHSYKNQRSNVAIHRLLAVAEYGFDAVVDNDVHHQNHIPWDNRAENIELMDKKEHGRLHSIEYYHG